MRWSSSDGRRGAAQASWSEENRSSPPPEPVAISFGAIATVLTVWLSGSHFSPSSEQ
jgi:hypothetical protein